MYNRNSKIDNSWLPNAIIERCNFGESDSVPVNQNPSKDFNIDPDTGRPLDQIQLLVRSQLAAEQMAMFAELDEFKSNYLPKDMKDSDALKYLAPRWCQLPSQLSAFQSYIMAQRDLAAQKAADDVSAAAAKKAADDAVDAASASNTVESKSD